MLIKVREGVFNPAGALDRDESLEPQGRELWVAEVDHLTVTALHGAGVGVEPGTWYSLEEFEGLLRSANLVTAGEVFSTVSMKQAGVSKPWTATIEVGEANAALMVCRSVLAHVVRLRSAAAIWIRLE